MILGTSSKPVADETAAGWASRRWPLVLVPLLLLAMVIYGRDLLNESVGNPDADRLLMDGVFFYDFFRLLPRENPLDFAIAYYAQYPALSLGYKPPLVPIIEALFNGLFGIHVWSGRLAIILLGLVGCVFLFALLRRMYSTSVALIGTGLYVTAPYVAQWSWYTMTEIPAISLTLVAAYFFYIYLETERPWHLFACAFFVACAAYAKQPAGYIALWFLLFALTTWGPRKLLGRKEPWIAAAFLIILVAPLIAITLYLGGLNVTQSIGIERSDGTPYPPFYGLESLLGHVRSLVDFHLTWPVLALSGAGLIVSVVRRDKRVWFFVSLIVVTYLLFTYVPGKNPRYTMFWIPAFIGIAATPFYYLTSARLKIAAVALYVVVATHGLYTIYFETDPRKVTGFQAAARVAMENSESPIILVDAYNNGYFTYFVRQQDIERRFWVLRADKILSSAAMVKGLLKIHVETEDDITQLLDKYGVSTIVVEANELIGIPVHVMFREYLKGPDFELIEDISTEGSTDKRYQNGQSLLIYRYLNWKRPTADTITLEMPIIGRTFVVPLEPR